MNPTVLLIPLCGITVLGAGLLAGRLGEGTALRAIGTAMLLFGAFGILTLLFARRLKVFVDQLAAGAKDGETDPDQGPGDDRHGGER
ncbi:hypothetical protein FKB34_08320 [Glycocaulis profundi]|nr:hypothetical protein FKB34_08320 [Glycocaulis profundi]